MINTCQNKIIKERNANICLKNFNKFLMFLHILKGYILMVKHFKFLYTSVNITFFKEISVTSYSSIICDKYDYIRYI